MLLKFFVFASIVVVLGCGPSREAIRQQESQQREAQQRAFEQRRAQEAQEFAALKQASKLRIEQNLAQIRGTTLPKNYKVQIDTYFVRTLKDPDSRKIEYRSNPYGSLVCGTINARNSYGGYTGNNPFYAYFANNGQLEVLQSNFSLLKTSLDLERELELNKALVEIGRSTWGVRRSTQPATAADAARIVDSQLKPQKSEEMSSDLEHGIEYKLLRDCNLPTP